MAQPPFIHYFNAAETGVVSCPDESPTAPAANLANPDPSAPLMTTTAADSQIDLHWGGAACQVACVGLWAVNFDDDPGAEAEVRLSDQHPYGNVVRTVVLSRPPYAIAEAIAPAPEIPRGRFAFFAVLSGGVLVPDPVTVYSIRILLRGAAGLSHWRIGCLWAGPLWTPATALSAECSFELSDRSQVDELVWGGFAAEPGAVVERETAAFVLATRADAEALANLYTQVGQVRPIVWWRRPTTGAPESWRDAGGLRRFATRQFELTPRGDMIRSMGPGRGWYDVRAFGLLYWR